MTEPYVFPAHTPYRPLHAITPRASEMTGRRTRLFPGLGDAVRDQVVKAIRRASEHEYDLAYRLEFGDREPDPGELAAWRARREANLARIRAEQEAEEARVERLVVEYPQRVAESSGLRRALLEAHPPALTGAYRHCGGCEPDEYGFEPAWPCFHYSLALEHDE